MKLEPVLKEVPAGGDNASEDLEASQDEEVEEVEEVEEAGGAGVEGAEAGSLEAIVYGAMSSAPVGVPVGSAVPLSRQWLPAAGWGAAVSSVAAGGSLACAAAAKVIRAKKRKAYVNRPLAKTVVCEYCGATWRAGSVLTGESQSYRSKCPRGRTRCFDRAAYAHGTLGRKLQ